MPGTRIENTGPCNAARMQGGSRSLSDWVPRGGRRRFSRKGRANDAVDLAKIGKSLDATAREYSPRPFESYPEREIRFDRLLGGDSRPG